MNCHICNIEADEESLCRQCDECVCDEHTVTFTLHNQIDYILCKDCGEDNKESFGKEMIIKEEMKLGDKIIVRETGAHGIVTRVEQREIVNVSLSSKIVGDGSALTKKFHLKDLNKINWDKPNWGELEHPRPQAEDYIYKKEELEIEKEIEEIEKEPDWIQYEERPTRMTNKILTTIKRFVLTKDLTQYHRQNHREGDIFEESFDKPNEFWNISLSERCDGIRRYCHTYMRRINYENTDTNSDWFNILEPIEDIDTKESYYFQQKIKKAASLYKSKMRKFALLNEELTSLRHILEIEEEND